MKHKIYFDLEDMVDLHPSSGEPELQDELEHYNFVSETTIECIYSRAQNGVRVSEVQDTQEYHTIGEIISFSDIDKNIIKKFIMEVFR